MIGWIGLGHIGRAMAERLSEEYELLVWNRSIEKARGFKNVAKTPEEVAEKCYVIFLSLYDSEAVRQVSERLLKADLSWKIVVDPTTNHHEKVLEFHEMYRNVGAFYLESPVIGSVIPARNGQLTILVSGEREAFEKVRPYLEKLGKKIFHFEEPGKATKLKLINNFVLGAFMAALGEAVALGEKAGIPKEELIEVLENGAGNSVVLKAKKEKLLGDDYSTHFSVKNLVKDLSYAYELAVASRKAVPLNAAVRELYRVAFERDMEELDFSVVYKLLREL
ncbi:6-phosphogluconate dehydrogenase [Thermococcus litoralis DSM 5473]|uniref:6-phosphogluconate dehydrogenase n=1 Tax=Thermococcus litoralis (strain ATCC 51850 / DSM 5473 / JCM 8560 / NS-C) TaxID=523849 RepID=H3ZRN5_THELN|nr:NAD(P)-dependent oxidoreductase [Thermococcus litoralis]EHR77441.1 6-phosphogluconate dehydrogenase [Thermococcus litoralis DSM 5473]